MHKLVFYLLLFQINITYAIENIIVQGLFKNTAIVMLDGKRRMLKVGMPSPEGVLLIKSSSESAIIEIEGKQKTYKLGRHISNNFKAPSSSKAVVIAPTRSGMYLVNGSINSFPVKFLVDTGATLIAMSETQAKRLGLDYKLGGEIGRSSTASGTTKSWYISLKKVKVGSILLRDVKAAVLKGDHPTEVLLGNSFLNKLQMNRDGKLMELRLK
ncbi:MAG: TIGR02281 family clan AA aspartic protease [Gammaproteobacteria bacterium]